MKPFIATTKSSISKGSSYGFAGGSEVLVIEPKVDGWMYAVDITGEIIEVGTATLTFVRYPTDAMVPSMLKVIPYVTREGYEEWMGRWT